MLKTELDKVQGKIMGSQSEMASEQYFSFFAYTILKGQVIVGLGHREI